MATPPVFTAGAVLTAAQMNAIGGWLLSSGSMGTSTTKTVDNVFTSDYDNYYIIIQGLKQAGTTNSLQWRTGGATNTTSNYAYGRSYQDTSAMAWEAGSTGTTSLPLGSTVATVDYSFEMLVTTPFATNQTQGWFRQVSNNTTPVAWFGWNIFKATTSFDGFIFTTGGNMSAGTYRVYGLRN
jgi:hypothetical protein